MEEGNSIQMTYIGITRNPHTPQQNGTAERKINRSLLNAARSMLHAAKLEIQSKFWEEAIAKTCYI